MSKKIPLLIAVLLIACISVGVTLAYYTTDISATNVVTIGLVKVEPKVTTPSETSPRNTIVPGVEYPGKSITVSNVGENGAYIRVKVTSEGWSGSKNGADTNGAFSASYSGTDWEYKTDGYYYYKKSVDPKNGSAAATTPLTALIKLDGQKAGNDYADAKMNIQYEVQAIQSDHIDGKDGSGYPQWPKSEIIQAIK